MRNIFNLPAAKEVSKIVEDWTYAADEDGYVLFINIDVFFLNEKNEIIAMDTGFDREDYGKYFGTLWYNWTGQDLNHLKRIDITSKQDRIIGEWSHIELDAEETEMVEIIKREKAKLPPKVVDPSF